VTIGRTHEFLTLAAIAIAANDPEAVSLARVMSFLPFGRDHRADADLDNLVADGKSGFLRHPHKVAMRPLGAVVIHHVGDFGEQQAARF
jgi:hypothetical protein